MFGLHSQQRFLLYSLPTDMRKSFDGLAGLVRNELGQEPENGTVYLFVNKRRDRLKVLQGNTSGYTLYYKRLERGTFELPLYDEHTRSLKLNYAQLVLLVDGLTITNLQRRKGRSNTG